MSLKKKYNISFGIEKTKIKRDSKLVDLNLNEIIEDQVQLKEENFRVYDYDCCMTIKYLKEYFLTTFGHKYKNCCTCVLFVYRYESSLFKKPKYFLLSKIENEKISSFNIENLYIIKRNAMCECEYKEYQNYMNKPKLDIISELKKFKNLYYPLEELNNKYMKELEELRKENKVLKKEH